MRSATSSRAITTSASPANRAPRTLLGIGSAILGSAYGSGAGNAAGQIGGAAAQTFYLLPNSREQESEADIVGQKLAAEAGFDPRQAVNLWQNMIAAGGSRPPQWLSTHPDPQSRIAELSGRAGVAHAGLRTGAGLRPYAEVWMKRRIRHSEPVSHFPAF